MTYEEYEKALEKLDNEAYEKRCEVYESGLDSTARRMNLDVLYDEERRNKLALKKEFWQGIQLGDGVTLSLWSDAEAFTVIGKTPCTITVQRDKATLKPGWKPEWEEGGFCGHCTNQSEQEYDYERNPNGQKVTLRWSDKYGCYVNKGWRSCEYGRHEFYDYNY